jgi:hypothetical protein
LARFTEVALSCGFLIDLTVIRRICSPVPPTAFIRAELKLARNPTTLAEHWDAATAFDALTLRRWLRADLGHDLAVLDAFVVAALAFNGTAAQPFTVEFLAAASAGDFAAGRSVPNPEFRESPWI